MSSSMSFETISAGELDRLADCGDCVVIDLRTPQEYQQMHFQGAINIPYEELERIFALFRSQKLVFYCERGSLSMAAAREAAVRGYAARSVVGGILAYRGDRIIYGSVQSR